MTNIDMLEILGAVGSMRNEDRKLPVKLSFALNRNQAMLLETYKAYEATLKEIPEDDKTSIDELLNTDIGPIPLQKVKFEDIENADLTINEVDVIQRLMLIEE